MLTYILYNCHILLPWFRIVIYYLTRMKHINTPYHYMQDQVNASIIQLHYIASFDKAANISIKALLPHKHIHICKGNPSSQWMSHRLMMGISRGESIDGQLAKGSHPIMGISKEKSLRTHHQ